nr:MAG TPA: hypothetical protein [Caudoviricetes sp.]
MKTQITSLINGTRNIRRDLSNPKYIDCPKATSHIGYAGTSLKLRAEIAEKVIAENPDGMDVEMFGKKFHLLRSASVSGKTVWFSTEISPDEFMLLSGYAELPFKQSKECKFALEINNDMNVLLHKWCRANENATMKHRGYDYIDEAFVTII